MGNKGAKPKSPNGTKRGPNKSVSSPSLVRRTPAPDPKSNEDTVTDLAPSVSTPSPGVPRNGNQTLRGRNSDGIIASTIGERSDTSDEVENEPTTLPAGLSTHSLLSSSGVEEVTGSNPTSKSDLQHIQSEVADEIETGLSSVKKVNQQDFELMKVIGRGSFGKVMQVRHIETGNIYAMKVMNKSMIIAKHQVTHAKDEKSILQQIKHPFIVNLHYAFQSPDKLYLILDYINGGELFYHLKRFGRFDEERAKFYGAEIASALIHLHRQGFVYRDLKPENILLDSKGHVVITDFGLSKQVMDDGTSTFCGTPEYLAPEGLKHSYPVDWWSLGTLMYEMLTGLPPFFSEVLPEMYHLIVSGDLVFPSELSDEVCDLLAGFLDRDPDTRLGGDDVMDHPFFDDIDWPALNRKEIEPPWKPVVHGKADTSMIDEFFLKESAVDSYSSVSPLEALTEDDKDTFDGFTYEATGILSATK